MPIDKEKILDNAQKYILKRQPKKAIKEYLSLIEISPKNKRLYLKIGDLYLKIGENEKAVKEYFKLADLYIEEDLNFRAISIYKKILYINPKHIEALHKIAQLYLKEGLAGSAKNYYQSILEIKPDDLKAAEALKNLDTPQQSKEVQKKIPIVESSILRQRYPSAKKEVEEKPNGLHASSIESSSISYQKEIPSSDKDLEMHYHLGIAYKEMELYDGAISEFELASVDPSMKFDCYTMLGSCYMEKGDYNKSIEYYKVASEIKGLSDKKLARLKFNLGLAYESNGMISQAKEALNQAINLDSNFPEVAEKIKKLQASDND